MLVTIVGFARTFFLRAFFDVPEIRGQLYLHGIVLTAWFLLLFTQTCLVATKRLKVHQQLGMAGVALAGCVVFVSVWTLVARDAPVIDEFPNRALPNLASLIAFSLCVGSAIRLRKKPEAHKRLMLIGSIIITAPALDRVARLKPVNEFFGAFLPEALPPEVAFALLATVGMLLVVLIHDLLTRKRPHVATIYGVLCVFMVGPAISAAITLSGAWSAFVRWVA